MRRNKLILGVFLVFFCMVLVTESEAGTFMFGVKTWYTTWESSVLDWFEKNLIADFASLGREIDTDKDAGSGYLAGPLIGYQTEDGKWSFSFAPMVISSFEQDWEGDVAGMEIDADVDLERTDLDFAVSYAINKHVWVFWGYKYQWMEIDFTLSYDTMMGSIENEYKLESEVHIPTVGTGFVYPVSSKVALSTQLGLLYSIPRLEMTDADGTKHDIWTEGTAGFNGEISMSYRPIDSFVFQLGYRYQFFRLDAREPDSEKTESDDITHGPTFSGVWIF